MAPLLIPTRTACFLFRQNSFDGETDFLVLTPPLFPTLSLAFSSVDCLISDASGKFDYSFWDPFCPDTHRFSCIFFETSFSDGFPFPDFAIAGAASRIHPSMPPINVSLFFGLWVGICCWFWFCCWCVCFFFFFLN